MGDRKVELPKEGEHIEILLKIRKWALFYLADIPGILV